MAGKADGTIYVDTKINSEGIEIGSKKINAALKNMAHTIDTSMQGYNKKAMKFIEDYINNTNSASQKNNEFRSEVEKAKSVLEELEGKGLWYGDEEYDNAVIHLERLEQAAKDYKKELVSPSESANPFGLDTLAGKIREAEIKLSQLADAGKGLGSEEFDEAYRELSALKSEAKEYRRTLETPTNFVLLPGLDTYDGQIIKLENELQRLKEAGKGLGDPAYDEVYRKLAIAKDEAKQYAAELAKTPAQIQKEEEKIASMNQKLEETRAKEVQAIVEAERLKAIGENAKVSNQHIVDLNNELTALKERQNELSAAGVGRLGYEEFEQNSLRIREINSELNEYQAAINSSEESTNLFSASMQKLKSAAGYAEKALDPVIRSIGSKFFSAVKRAATAMLGLNKNTKKSGNAFSAGLKTMLKYGLGIRSLYTLVNKLRTGIVEGFQNLAQYDKKTNASLSSLKSSLTQLKNSLATAFNPILNVVAPILTTFINMISKAATYVGMFIAALTGQTKFTKAVAVQEDYAASLSDTAESAKEASAALGDYDKLQVISSSTATASSNTGVSPDEMFEVVEIGNKFYDLADKIKNAWENADFTEIGTTIGTKLKSALDNIPWEDIKKKSEKIGTSIATLINGFVETPGLFESIGKTIGEGINTGIAGAKGFFSTTKFDEIGKAVADGVNSAMETVEWDELAETVSLGIEGALDTAISFLDEFDWEKFADSISEFLAHVDWGGIFGRLGLLLLEVFRGFFTTGNKLGVNFTSWLADYFRSIGWDSVAGFFEGLSEKISKYGKTLEESFQKIIDWVKEKLGIHSPSTVFAEIGEFCIAGLKNGISNALSGIKQWILEKIEPLKEAWESIKTKTVILTATVKNTAASVLSTIQSGWEAVKTKSATLTATAKNAASSVLSTVKSGWEAVKTKSATLTATAKNSAATVLSTLKSGWETIKTKSATLSATAKNASASALSTIKSGWSAIQSKTVSLGITLPTWSSIQTKIKNLINNFISYLNTNLIKKINNAMKITVPKNSVTSFLGINGSHTLLSLPNIPKLATGAVIPPNKEFMAILGDQKHGTNIETPEALLRKIIKEELGSMQQESREPIILQLPNGKAIAQLVWDEEEKRYKQTGRYTPRMT